MAAAATDLTTLANLKAFLSNPGTNDDTLLQSLLTNASLFIENYINRDIVSLTYNVVIDGTGSRTMVLSDYPVTCLLYTSPSPRDRTRSRMPSSA